VRVRQRDCTDAAWWLCEWMRVTQTWACSQKAVGALLAKCNVRTFLTNSLWEVGKRCP
jgi:hypothetical protein